MVDLFGFHALQLGLPELDALRANRMPHRWLATESRERRLATARPPAARLPRHDAPPRCRQRRAQAPSAALAPRAAVACCDFDALPFDSNSLDLVVLPHALELARDPHLALREVERVLVPEGRVLIVGFNPASLWGLRQRLGRLRRRLASDSQRDLFLPSAGEFMRYRRLRDWLRLLSFEVEAGRFGCYRPAARPRRAGSRASRWMERAGERWWPVFGARLLHRRGQAGARHAAGRPGAQGPAAARRSTAPAPVRRDAADARRRSDDACADSTPIGPHPMKWLAYTDGACAPTNPGPGRLGRRADRTGDRTENDHFGFIGLGTNQIAELTAAIEGLAARAGRRCASSSCSDSQYVLKGLTEWRAGWERSGWRNSKDEPVAEPGAVDSMLFARRRRAPRQRALGARPHRRPLQREGRRAGQQGAAR